MKRLCTYFCVSLIINLFVLGIIFLLNKNRVKNSDLNGILIPAKILPKNNDPNKRERDDDFAVSQYRSNKTKKGGFSGPKQQNTTSNKVADDIKKKHVVEIPDMSEKQIRFVSVQKYKQYKKQHVAQGMPVSEIRVGFPKNVSETMVKEIINYFGLKIVGYGTNLHYLIVGEAPGYRFSMLKARSEIEDFYRQNSNRTIELNGRYLGWIREKIRRQGLSDNDLIIAFALGNSAGYFHWKETLAAEYLSMDLREIQYTQTRFFKTSQGYWLLLLEGVGLADGRYVEVEDRELKEVTSL